MSDASMAVIDRDGERRPIIGRERTEGSTLDHVIVQLTDGRPLWILETMLEPAHHGHYRLLARFADFESAEGRTEAVIPVVEERPKVGRRIRETQTVRVSKKTHERQETVDEPTIHERVEVERVAVNRPVDEVEDNRYEGETLIIPVYREELVLQKRLVLKEEIRITKRREEEHHPQQITLREQEVEIERQDVDGAEHTP
jgi:uncharacterized protein (TIGR02271 family)